MFMSEFLKNIISFETNNYKSDIAEHKMGIHFLKNIQKNKLTSVKTKLNQNQSVFFNQNKILKPGLNFLTINVKAIAAFTELACLWLLETCILTFKPITIGEQYAGN